VLANVVSADHVPVDSHFLDNLGADSLLMAEFCARVRKRPDLPTVSMTGARWHGNPATQHQDDRDMADPTAMVHADA
jgi:hypothetical protein